MAGRGGGRPRRRSSGRCSLGMAKARYYLLTGEMITGEEAERLGMVSKAVPRDQVLDEALRVADLLAVEARSRLSGADPEAEPEQLAARRQADLRPIRRLRDAHLPPDRTSWRATRRCARSGRPASPPPSNRLTRIRAISTTRRSDHVPELLRYERLYHVARVHLGDVHGAGDGEGLEAALGQPPVPLVDLGGVALPRVLRVGRAVAAVEAGGELRPAKLEPDPTAPGGSPRGRALARYVP